MKKIKESIREKEYKILMNYITNNETMRDNTKANMLKVFTLLYYTGARLNELTQLRNKDILDLLTNKEIILLTHKTKNERKVYFTDEAIKSISKVFIKLQIDSEPEDYKVVRVKGKAFSSPSTIGFIQQTNKIIQEILGDRYTSNSFRQGLITELGAKSVNPKIIQTFIGHKDIKTTMNYIKPSEEDIRNSLIR